MPNVSRETIEKNKERVLIMEELENKLIKEISEYLEENYKWLDLNLPTEYNDELYSSGQEMLMNIDDKYQELILKLCELKGLK